jgi:hypothetical protein
MRTGLVRKEVMDATQNSLVFTFRVPSWMTWGQGKTLG